jgi:hypothetical protein
MIPGKPPLSERLRILIERQGTSPRQFCAAHGLDYNTMMRTLRGDGVPAFDFIERVAEAVPQASTEYLLRGTGPPMQETPESAAERLALMGELLAVYRRMFGMEGAAKDGPGQMKAGPADGDGAAAPPGIVSVLETVA